MEMINTKRQQDALDYALNTIKESPLAAHIKGLYLYGSCARNEEKFESDVDLFLELDEGIKNNKKLKEDTIKLKSYVTSPDYNDPETDLKVVYGDDWKSNDMLFFQNVKREGKQIWL